MSASPDSASATPLDAPIHRFVMPPPAVARDQSSTSSQHSHRADGTKAQQLQTPHSQRQASRGATPTPGANGIAPAAGAAGTADGSISKSLWSSGRAAWYTPDGLSKAPFIIGVCGGSASGKTTVCDEIIARLNVPWVTMVCIDRFYRPLSPEQRELVKQGKYNFDSPQAFDFNLAYDMIKQLASGRSVALPRYDFVTHSRSAETDTVYGSDVLIIEGILSMWPASLRSLMDLKIYVDTDSDVCLARRITRDMAERGRDLNDVLQQYMATVKPSFEQFIQPTKRHADLVIPRGGDNWQAIDILVQHIRTKLAERSVEGQHLLEQTIHEQQNRGMNALLSPDARAQLLSPTLPSASGLLLSPSASPSLNSSASLNSSSQRRRTSLHSGQQLPANAIVMPSNNVLRSIHTELRDANTCQEQFQFSLHRLGHLLLAAGINALHEKEAQRDTQGEGQQTTVTVQSPQRRSAHSSQHATAHSTAQSTAQPSPQQRSPVLTSVTTPTGSPFTLPLPLLDVESSLCCVSVVRGGETLELPIRECLPAIQIGKIVIAQSCLREEGARLYYCKLPSDISAPHRRVLLLDATLSTGNALCMAIRVLLDHGVVESNIVVLCIAASVQGLRAVASAFPAVTVVTSWLDAGLDEQFYLLPGMGAVGDRYFATDTYSTAAKEQHQQQQQAEQQKPQTQSHKQPEQAQQ